MIVQLLKIFMEKNIKGIYYNKQVVNLSLVASINFDDDYKRIRFYGVGPSVIDEWEFDTEEEYQDYKVRLFNLFNL